MASFGCFGALCLYLLFPFFFSLCFASVFVQSYFNATCFLNFFISCFVSKTLVVV